MNLLKLSEIVDDIGNNNGDMPVFVYDLQDNVTLIIDHFSLVVTEEGMYAEIVCKEKIKEK